MTITAPGIAAASPSGPRARAGAQVVALFLCFLGFYLLTASGHFYTVDEETLYLMTESLVERGTILLPPASWGAVGQYGLVVEPNATGGPIEVIFTPGQPVAAIPFYLLGRALVPFFPPGAQGYVTRFCVSLFGAFVTAATVALLYALARQLGYRGGAALGLAAIYGLATTAWPHGRTFLAEPLTAFLLLLAFAAIRRGTTAAGDARWVALAGAALVAACLTKPHAAIALPPLGLYLLHAVRPARYGRRALGFLAACGGGMLAVLAAFMALNLALYGTPLRLGYGNWPLALFNNPFWQGFYGLTSSSGKGIVWYAPPVVLGLAAAWPFARRHRAEALTCLAVFGAHLLFYSKLRFWHGDWIWGPRFLTIALPFALLPAVALLDGLRARPVRLALVALVAGAGVVAQLLGAGVNFAWYIIRSDDAAARFFTPAAAPLIAHARMAADRWAEWRAQAFPAPDSVVLADGFRPGEEGGAALFPRWTDGAGMIALNPVAREALTVKVTFFDHRPAALRTTPPTILLNGVPLDAGAIDRHDFSGTGEGWTYGFTVPSGAIGRTGAIVVLRSDAWNPVAAGVSDRNEELGVFVHNVEAWREGRPLAVRMARMVPPIPADARERHWWFNDDRAADRPGIDAPAHQLVDWWAWYAANAGLGVSVTRAWIAGYSLVAGGCLLAGIGLGARSLRVPSAAITALARSRRRRLRAAT